jgi:hypothetical protein
MDNNASREEKDRDLAIARGNDAQIRRQQQPADVVEFCTGCSHIGDRPKEPFISCCPERKTVLVPIAIADMARRGFLTHQPAGARGDAVERVARAIREVDGHQPGDINMLRAKAALSALSPDAERVREFSESEAVRIMSTAIATDMSQSDGFSDGLSADGYARAAYRALIKAQDNS